MRHRTTTHARRTLAALGGLLAMLLWTTVALAAAGEGHGGEDPSAPTPVPWNDVIEAIVNFSLFLFLIYYFARKPIMEYLAQRRMKLAANIEESEKLREEAEAKVNEYQSRLERIETERQEILEGYRSRAEAERKVILADARAVAERMKADAKVAIDQELVRAREQLKERIVEEAVDLARQKIRSRMDASTNARLVDEYTSELRQLPRSSAEGGA